ncbi:CBO0543 family protein [Aquibacillus rhizosphaerae]|uniref:CBO0543 family protein n=1 Tax=Aquibacillus rhizosphaerae TaxID=3051431 RepID=A0ABT7LB13_9BACI|nr:CBO0543 family protein [Aquibacillus sp. LR5S19]MDL4843061.1 CBO0543 family protein [Aquibacillus sp. LR5S19]
MYFIYSFAFLLAGLKWGDWRNWRAYYPTILFIILIDILYNFLFYDYPMWSFEETVFGKSILSKHTYISIMNYLIVYPALILLFLGNYPKFKVKQVQWITIWVILFISKEMINLKIGLINHHHTWSISWSVIFDIVMFIVLRLHFKKPLIAWGISILWIILLWELHAVPLDVLK